VITGGRNMGRTGTIVHRERHIGGFDIVHVKDVLDRTFATRSVSELFYLEKPSLMTLRLVQIDQYLRHRRWTETMDFVAKGQGCQIDHLRGERPKKEGQGAGVKGYKTFLFLFLHAYDMFVCPPEKEV
jgi:hypothetical protein